MEQGSKEWHEWRDTGIGSSDACVIMGTSPWSTPRKIAEIKRGIRERDKANFAMKRGLDLEHEARLAYEKHTGEVMQPDCIVNKKHKWMKASVDGINISRDLILEIKVPGKEDHLKAVEGIIPEKYYPQVQHQMMVADVPIVHYWSYYKSQGALVMVVKDQEYQDELFEKEKEFYEKYIKGDALPDLTDKDIVKRDDEAWINLVDEYLKVKYDLEPLIEKEKELKKQLYDLAGDNSAEGNGIRVSRFFKKGNVDYKKVPELEGVDLEQYRKTGKVQYSLNMIKDNE